MDKMEKVQVVFPRKAALKFAVTLFWMATGSSRVGVIFKNDTIELLGADRIED